MKHRAESLAERLEKKVVEGNKMKVRFEKERQLFERQIKTSKECLMELIASYGNGLRRELFWEVMESKLVQANQDISAVIQNIREGEELENNLRIDFVTYRNHLWEVLGKIRQLPESKNRDLVPLFLDKFMAGEYVEIRKLAEDKEIEIKIMSE